MLTNFQIKKLIDISKKAGKEILKIYQKDFTVEYKEDSSPLTQADKVSNEIICSTLSSFDIPILSEENKTIPYEERKDWEYFWLVDPLDGTKEFIKKNGEFTTNIALIYKNKPIFGIVYAPVLDLLYYNDKNCAYKLTSTLKEKLPQIKRNKIFTIVASKSHLNEQTERFINNLRKIHNNIEFISKGSSLKLCMVAEGSADIYPRLAPTMEWDTAAADAILKASGKNCFIYHDNFDIENLKNNKSLLYNKEALLNPFFIAY